jgi:hypothetical protein
MNLLVVFVAVENNKQKMSMYDYLFLVFVVEVVSMTNNNSDKIFLIVI